MTGSEGGLDCEMVGVFPNSSLETPASEEVGISVQRHGRSYVGKEDHDSEGKRFTIGCAHRLGDFIGCGLDCLPRYTALVYGCAAWRLKGHSVDLQSITGRQEL